MKGLYKKIGVGVLAAAVVVGSGIFQGSSLSKISGVYANSVSAKHHCQFQSKDPGEIVREVNNALGEYKEIDKAILSAKNKEKFGYEVGYIFNSIKGVYGYYANHKDLFSCLYGHRRELIREINNSDNKESFYPRVGSDVYEIKIDKDRKIYL